LSESTHHSPPAVLAIRRGGGIRCRAWCRRPHRCRTRCARPVRLAAAGVGHGVGGGSGFGHDFGASRGVGPRPGRSPSAGPSTVTVWSEAHLPVGGREQREDVQNRAQRLARGGARDTHGIPVAAGPPRTPENGPAWPARIRAGQAHVPARAPTGRHRETHPFKVVTPVRIRSGVRRRHIDRSAC
jgi:hypothetical protein